jgi:putative ABC transport system permease protein
VFRPISEPRISERHQAEAGPFVRQQRVPAGIEEYAMAFQKWIYTIPLRLRSLFRRRQVEQELDEELRYHVEQQIERHVTEGISPAEARALAMRAIGGAEQRKEECRDVRGVALVDDLLRDTRHAFRTLRRDAGFTSGVVLILALGVGANVAVFSTVYGILLRPLPYREPDRLFVIRELVPQLDDRTHAANERHFLEWRACRCFEEVALSNTYGEANLTGEGEPERVPLVRATPNVFSMLGVSAQLGRTFAADDVQPGHQGGALPAASSGENVAVISDGLWRRRFGSDPDIVGTPIGLDGVDATIVGVLPPGFRHYDRGGTTPDGRADVYLPWVVDPPPYTGWAGGFSFAALGRLRDGLSAEAAVDELNAIQATIATRFEERWASFDLRAQLIPLREWLTGESRAGLLLLLAAVGAAFLVACLNIANLMLVRATARSREAGLRAALGASRLAIFRGVLIESATLALAGAAMGTALAAGFLRVFAAIAPAGMPRVDEVHVDWTVLVAGLALAVAATLAFGVLPAGRMTRVDPQQALRANTRAVTDSGRRSRQALVSLEVGLSAGLLAVAGLLLASFVRLERVDRGFDPANVLTAEISLPAARYPSPGRYGDAAETRLRFFDALIERLEAAPGGVAAGVTTMLPLRGNNWGAGATPEGVELSGEEQPDLQYRWVSPGYFRAMGLPLRAGRSFVSADRPRLVAVLSERAARLLWPEEQAIGRRFYTDTPDRLYEVVGVVPDVHTEDPATEPFPLVYLPAWLPGSPIAAVAVRTTASPSAAAGILRDVVASLDRDLAISDVQTMAAIDRAALGERRFQLILIVMFAVASLLVAALGTYSVLAYSVATRMHEIAIRMALGARQRTVMAMVFRQGMGPVLLGLGIGVAGAMAAGRLLSALLYAVTPTDPATLATVVAVTVGAATLACWIPARRAARTSALRALRYD